MDFRAWVMDFRAWVMDFGEWVMDFVRFIDGKSIYRNEVWKIIEMEYETQSWVMGENNVFGKFFF